MSAGATVPNSWVLVWGCSSPASGLARPSRSPRAPAPPHGRRPGRGSGWGWTARGHALEGRDLAWVVQVAQQVVKGPVLEHHRHHIVEPVRAIVSSHDQPPSRVEQRAFRLDTSTTAKGPASAAQQPNPRRRWHSCPRSTACRPRRTGRIPHQDETPSLCPVAAPHGAPGTALGDSRGCAATDGGPPGGQDEGGPPMTRPQRRWWVPTRAAVPETGGTLSPMACRPTLLGIPDPKAGHHGPTHPDRTGCLSPPRRTYPGSLRFLDRPLRRVRVEPAFTARRRR